MMLHQITTAVEPLSPEALGGSAAARFDAAPRISGLAVVDPAGAPVGHVDRAAFMARLQAEPELASQPISQLMDCDPLIINGSAAVADVVTELLTHPANLGRGFIAVQDGLYVGIGGTLDLLRAVHEDNQHKARALQDAAAALAEAKAAARQADNLLKDSINAMRQGVAIFDADDRYMLWNNHYEVSADLFGIVREGVSFVDILRHDLRRGRIPEANDHQAEWLEHRLALRAQHSAIRERSLPDGRWLRIEEQKLASGGTIMVTVDITEHRQREASFKLMFDENPVPLVVFDEETLGFLAVNPAACGQYGYSLEQFLNLDILDVLAPEEHQAAISQPTELKYPFRPDRSWTHLDAQGRRRNVLTYFRKLTYAGRAAIIAASVDVTAQRRAEVECEQARRFLDAVIEAIPETVLVKEGADHRLVLINRAGEALFGKSREQMLGRNHDDLVANSDIRTIHDEAIWTSGQLMMAEEVAVTTPAGLRYLQIKKMAMPMQEGEPSHLVAICEDITERKTNAEALRAARDQAEAASLAKTQFLANMSHEIRTPLNGVTGVVSVLAGTPLSPQQREMVQIIQDSAVTLELLLSDVLDLARVESGKVELRNDPFQIEDLIRRCGSLFRSRAQQKGLDFEIEIAPDAAGYHRGDPARLQQILNNLLSNAIKFTKSGAVRLRVDHDGETGHHRFTVTDTGIGFDEAAADKIFQRFEQADGSITRQFGGTGLGLAISKDLANMMGGDLSARSTPGDGAVFTLALPLTTCAAPIAVTTAAPKRQRTADGEQALKILVADDHATNRQVVALILNAIGADLTMVENGQEAVEAFEHGAFDLVLMDLQMPVMDGLTAIRRIRAMEPEGHHTPVLALSANAMPEHVAGAAEAGADGHVSKPVDANTLITAIETALFGAEPWDAPIKARA